MIIPLTWLRACVPGIGDDTRQFIETITMSGTKVEGLTQPGEDITNVVVGKVLSIEKHPNADKLLVTKIDIGERELQIVTGATNLTVGDYVPVALDGARLAEGKRIKKGKLRGLDSEGMLCDIGELGYTRHDYPEAPEHGIYIFQQPQQPGADVKPILEITDEVVDFEIMSNRPDCNSVIGVACEAAAAHGFTFNPPQPVVLKEQGEGSAADLIAVEIQNAELCPRYIARVVKNVRIAPSPQWLRHRLTASGVRPINNIVDITNYVMLEYGQPMHAFDIEHIAGRKIIVRNAQQGEVFTTLDGNTRILDESMLVIADCEKAVAVAGVMGGENSMITENAATILFESANFNGTSVRLTSKKLGLRTDASARFEKGLDPNLAEAAVNRAMELIETLGCGEVVPGLADAYPAPRTSRRVMFSPARVNDLLGTEIGAADMITYLSRVGINTHERVSAGEYEAEIPTFRADVTREADIAEEVARFYGYNNIPSRHAAAHMSDEAGGRSERQRLTEQISTIMLGLGFSEAVTYPFESPKVFDKLLVPQEDVLRDAVRIQNPLGEDFSIMRTLTINALLESLSVNFNRRNDSARLFEIAYAYRPKALPLTELPDEVHTLTIAAYDRGGMDFYDLKGDVEQLLQKLGIVLSGDGARPGDYKPVFAPAALSHMHPGRTAAISLLPVGTRAAQDETAIGYVGELHPQVCENYEIGTRVYVAVLELAPLFEKLAGYRPTYRPLPKYPGMERDLALRVKQEVSAASVEAAIREKAGPLLTQVRLFDVYQGRQIEEGFKSMAYTLSFRAPDHTLTDEEVAKPLNQILENLRRKLDAVLRDK